MQNSWLMVRVQVEATGLPSEWCMWLTESSNLTPSHGYSLLLLWSWWTHGFHCFGLFKLLSLLSLAMGWDHVFLLVVKDGSLCHWLVLILHCVLIAPLDCWLTVTLVVSMVKPMVSVLGPFTSGHSLYLQSLLSVCWSHVLTKLQQVSPVALSSWMLNIVVHPATGRVNDHSMKHCRTCWFWLSSRYNFLKHERAGLKLTRACKIETVTHSCTAECSSLWSLLLQVAY